MTTLAPNEVTERQNRFTAAINRNGYAFQNTLLKHMQVLFAAQKSNWLFEAAEFPVTVKNHDTRIDFILHVHGTPAWILAECKRVNPEYSDWCFWRTPFVRRNHTDRYAVECVTKTEPADLRNIRAITHGIYIKSIQDAYHQGLSVKNVKKPSDQGAGDDAIEKAATQVFKGVNGMAHYLENNPLLLGPKKIRFLIPVIFTTARLWVCDTDLAQAELITGDINPADANYKEASWVLYQYVISQGIKNSLSISQNLVELSPMLNSSFIRTVAIVNPSGIEAFLRYLDPDNFQTHSIP